MQHWDKQQNIRFHYANCKTYNADFDGDEMNMHLPQDELGRSEAYHIVATPYQYLAPTSGQPLRGLIQDHNSISVLLTKRDTLLTRDAYCQLVFSALQALPQFGAGMGTQGGDGAHGQALGERAGTALIPLLPPAILGPRGRRLWTGKQVISTVLTALSAHLPDAKARRLHLDARTKIGDGLWGAGFGAKDVIPVGESSIVIRGNELLAGVLDKQSLGNSSFGLVHAVYEAYGAHAAGALLSATGRLLTVYLQWASTTCGIDDLVLTTAADGARAALIEKGRVTGALASAAFALGPAAGVAHEAADGVPVTATRPWNAAVTAAIKARVRGGAAAGDVTGAAATAVCIELDNAVKSAMAGSHSAIIEACLPYGLIKSFPKNQFRCAGWGGARGRACVAVCVILTRSPAAPRLALHRCIPPSARRSSCCSLMVTSGAKGSMVNHAMIAVGLGQQELEVRTACVVVEARVLCLCGWQWCRRERLATVTCVCVCVCVQRGGVG